MGVERRNISQETDDVTLEGVASRDISIADCC